MAFEIASCSEQHVHFHSHVFVALRRQDTRTTVPRGSDESEDSSSTLGPQLSSGVTERSNSTTNGRTSHILYVITSSPGKPEHNMPGQWAGRDETTGHTASMLTSLTLSSKHEPVTLKVFLATSFFWNTSICSDLLLLHIWVKRNKSFNYLTVTQ